MDPEMVGFTLGLEGDMDRCVVCHREEPLGTLLRCGACGEKKHPRCADPKWRKMRNGPWHCDPCKVRMFAEGRVDLLLDEELMRYLSHGEAPKAVDAFQRVVTAA